MDDVIESALAGLPEPLQEPVIHNWQTFKQAAADLAELPQAVAETLPRVWATSNFVTQQCLRQPALLIDLSRQDLLQQYSGETYHERLTEKLASVTQETELMRELRQEGTTILMSTHQMHQVEELCDRILLIDDGRDVLYGNLDAIRRDYSGHAVLVSSADELPVIPGVEEVAEHNGAIRLSLAEDTTPQDVLRTLVAHEVILERFEIAVPTLDEIFIRVVAAQ